MLIQKCLLYVLREISASELGYAPMSTTRARGRLLDSVMGIMMNIESLLRGIDPMIILQLRPVEAQ